MFAQFPMDYGVQWPSSPVLDLVPQRDSVACQKQRVTLLVGIETGRKDWLGQNGLTVAPSNMFVLCWCVFPEHLLAMRPASIKHVASCDYRLSVFFVLFDCVLCIARSILYVLCESCRCL